MAGWTVLYFLVSPEDLLRRVGVENASLLLMALSVIGALGSMTTVSSYPAVVTFAAGGMSVLLIAAVSAVGLTIGDALFFWLATRARDLLSGRVKRWAEGVGEWLDERPNWVIRLVTFAWVGLLPLPNNVLTGGLALAGYRFRQILVPVLLGNATFPAAVAYLASVGVELY